MCTCAISSSLSVQRNQSLAANAHRRRLLAAGIATLFAPCTYANSVFVTNCNDSGPGSLRSAVSVAATSDFVNMLALTTANPGCAASTITLTTGDIVVNQDDLNIAGPLDDTLTVSGQYTPPTGPPTVEHKRIFTHLGTGLLILQHMSISHGYVASAGNASGGCIYSKGNVQLFAARVSDCSAISTNGFAYGGALFTTGRSSMYYANVTRNVVIDHGSGSAGGGAVWSTGGLSMRYSTVAGNSALCEAGKSNANFGGISSQGGNAYILSSTISGNSACFAIGGLGVAYAGSTELVNSTIANNEAKAGPIGGASLNSGTVSIFNSTVAFNAAATTGGSSPGLALKATTVTLYSNLLSNNVYGAGIANDITISSATVNGAKNLVFAPAASLPSGVIVGKCPLLGSLRDNGGLTETIAIESHSPAIDVGNNVFSTPLSSDQRGSPFVRSSGAAPDIGAYEVDQTDIVFTAGFDGCP